MRLGKAVHTDVTRLPLEELGAVDLLVAGFSCKSLSTMNRRRCSLVDKTSSSGQTWGGTLSYIARWLPKRILLENVLGLVRKCRSAPKDGQIGWTLIQTALASLGYVCGYHIVSPEHFLLPQRRLRVYVWAEHGLDNGPVLMFVHGGCMLAASAVALRHQSGAVEPARQMVRDRL